jgi:bifunctional ADP-heptose synthase (sugar kinase/adenylyltransferase)
MNPSVADRFLKNPTLFHGKRLLVAGDIALDRTFFCETAPAGRHAVHAGESIVDVRPGGDDFGTVGAAYNACLLSAAVGAEGVLVTVTGDDPEADRVAGVFAAAGVHANQRRLSGIQTVTRFRFFVNDPTTGRYRLHLRVDKDPDTALAFARSEVEFCAPGFLDWWEQEAESADAILLSDTGKGFLSRSVLVALDERTRRASERRVSSGKQGIMVVVDPKREWEKFSGLKVDVFKPNEVEASGAVQLPRQDRNVDAHVRALAGEIARKYGRDFPKTVITLGEHGAALVSTADDGGTVSLFPALQAREPAAGIAMHCGDMFASALALSLCVDSDMASGVSFANYAASLQVSMPIGRKIGASDLVDPLNIRHLQDHSLPVRELGKFSTRAKMA